MRKRLLAGTLFCLLALYATACWACPHCNIHNYLAKSVESSKNIYVGRVLSQVDEQHAEIKVLRVIRGERQAGEKVKTQMWMAGRDVGAELVFSDPTSWPPNYPVLPLFVEDEIRFLIQPQLAIADMDEGIRRVQGIGVETSKAGMEYVRLHRTGASAAIIKAIREIRFEEESGTEPPFCSYRLTNLVAALMAVPTKEAENFVVQETLALLGGRSEKLDIANFPHAATVRAEYLNDLLVQSAKSEPLQWKVRTSVLAAYPGLTGSLLTDVTYALVRSKASSPDSLAPLATDQMQKDMVAVGVLLVGNDSSRWWDWEHAAEVWKQALSVEPSETVRQRIQERLDSARRFLNRDRSTVPGDF